MTSAPPIGRPTASLPGQRVWFVLVLALAVAVRAWHLDTWSLWEDEEGSMSMALWPFGGFQGFFPLYFVVLKAQMQLTGLSVGAARALPALLGVLTVALTFWLFRPWCSPPAALLACLL